MFVCVCVCAGRGSVYDYQTILRQIRYVNTKPDNVNRRTFVLSCTEASKHVASNMLAVHVSVDQSRYFVDAFFYYAGRVKR